MTTIIYHHSQIQKLEILIFIDKERCFISMKIVHQVNCNNAPKNKTVTKVTEAILKRDQDVVNEYYLNQFDSLTYPELNNIDEITIVSAMSHGKSASSLCEYYNQNKKKYIGMFFEFNTFKAQKFKEIIIIHI